MSAEFPTDAEREAIDKAFGYVPESEPLEHLLALVGRMITARETAARREAWHEGYDEGVQRGRGLERIGHLTTRRHELGPIPTNPYRAKEADDDNA